MTLAQALAMSLGTQIQGGKRFGPADLEELLARVPVRLGGGKATLPLGDVVPAACMRDLERVCTDFERDC